MSWDGFQRYARESQAFLLRHRRSQDPTISFFWCAVLLHALFWSVLLAFLQPNVSDETLALLSLGRNFAWGYPSQPPLGVWAATLLTSLTAPSIWPLYVLTQVCAVVSVWCAWTLGRSFLQPWTALCAALVLLTGFSFTISAGSFTGAHLATAFWSLAILTFHEAFVNPQRRYWVLTGVALGLGFLCSYGTLLLLAAMGSFMIIDRRARRCWDSSWWMLALVAFGVVGLNHFWWLMVNDFQTIAGGFGGSSVAENSGESVMRRFSYLGAQIIGFFAICLLLHPVARRVNIVESANSDENDQEFTRIYLTWIIALPAAIILALSPFADLRSSAVSGVSLWVYLGVLLLMWSRLDERKIAWRHVILRTGAAAGFLAAVFVAQQVMLPRMTRQASSTLFPGRELAGAVQSAWERSGAQAPIPVLAGTPQLVRNAAWYTAGNSETKVSEAALVTAGGPAVAWEQDLVKEGGVLLWPSDKDDLPMIEQIRSRFGQERVMVTVLDSLELPWQTAAGISPVRVRMAMVRPAQYASFQVQGTREAFNPPVTPGQPNPYAPAYPNAPANPNPLSNSQQRVQQAQNLQNNLTPEIRGPASTIPNVNNNLTPQINRGGAGAGSALNQGSGGSIYNGGNSRSGQGIDPLAQPPAGANSRNVPNPNGSDPWNNPPSANEANRPLTNPPRIEIPNPDPFAGSTLPRPRNHPAGEAPAFNPGGGTIPASNNLNNPVINNPAVNPFSSSIPGTPRLDTPPASPVNGGTIPPLPRNLLPADGNNPPHFPAVGLNGAAPGADPFLANPLGGTPVNNPSPAPPVQPNPAFTNPFPAVNNPSAGDPFPSPGGGFGSTIPGAPPSSSLPRL